MTAAKNKLEFGDYQTPLELARASCRLLASLGVNPKSLLEPTCGVGHFLKAGIESFPDSTARGFEVNPEYAAEARAALERSAQDVTIRQQDFFDQDWREAIAGLPSPTLVLGNPPWVTNSALGAVGSSNLPVKSNLHSHSGLDALTGKSNFDISEYMLLHLAKALQGRDATLAMLCKTGVARKVMSYCWKRGLTLGNCHLFPIDAQKEFGASVDACFFVATLGDAENRCTLHQSYSDLKGDGAQLGYRDGTLIADMRLYRDWSFLRGPSEYVWRSGVKHDCAKVMEFREVEDRLINGLGQQVDLEEACIYPLLKSSSVAGGSKGRRKVLLTQHEMGEDTARLAVTSPRTWAYLMQHADVLDQRASIIYRKRPRFSIFGVGEYSFAPWKVAISGFYKRLEFRVIGPIQGKPAMLDDTSYFLPCASEEEATLIAKLLNSDPARCFLTSLVFWDAKRPITVDLLSQLSIERLAEHLGRADALRAAAPPFSSSQSLLQFA